MKQIYKVVGIVIIAFSMFLFSPPIARASDDCHGLGCLFSWNFGFTERAQIHEDAATDRAKIDADAQAEQARIQNAHDETLNEIDRQADIAIANAQRDGTIAQADKDKYIADVNAWKDAQIKALQLDTDKALAALNSQTQLGLASIHEVGETKRWSMTTELLFSLMSLGVACLVILYLIRRYTNPRQILIAGPQYRALPPGYRAELTGYRSQLAERSSHEHQPITYHSE